MLDWSLFNTTWVSHSYNKTPISYTVGKDYSIWYPLYKVSITPDGLFRLQVNDRSSTPFIDNKNTHGIYHTLYECKLICEANFKKRFI